MGERVNNVYGVLVIAYIVANVSIWSTYAKDDAPWSSVKFQTEDARTPIPLVFMSRLGPKDNDAIVFEHDHDEKESRNPDAKELENNFTEIPLYLIKRLNTVGNASELLNFIDSDTVQDYGNTEIGNRFGDDDDVVDRKAVVSAKPAICAPELVTVSLRNSDDRATFYYPSCTRVKRCGGCCSHELLSCQPSNTTMITYQVIETRYEGGDKLKYKGKTYVTVEEHTKCKCDCKVKQEDCNKFQDYNAGECSCVCTNVDEEMKCRAENETKLWDSKDCICGCRHTKECSTGFYFDQKTCNCSPLPVIRRRNSDNSSEMRHRWGENTQLNYKTLPRPVLPLSQEADKEDVI